MAKPAVNYTSIDTSIGVIHLASTEKGICLLKVGAGEQEFRKILGERFGTPVLRDDALRPAVEDLIAYLGGSKVRFRGPFDLRGTPFQLRVWRQLLTIPYGQVQTYREVAVAIGKPEAYRAVGNSCGANPVPLMVPCHRVVAANGRLGGYGLGVELKKRLLEMEGHRGLMGG